MDSGLLSSQSVITMVFGYSKQLICLGGHERFVGRCYCYVVSKIEIHATMLRSSSDPCRNCCTIYKPLFLPCAIVSHKYEFGKRNLELRLGKIAAGRRANSKAYIDSINRQGF